MSKTKVGIDAQLKEFLANQFQVDKESISDDLSFGDLPQWDSLGHMSLMAAIENQFGVEVNADAIADLVNYKAILDFLVKSNHE
jgi:acyl carrier protein